MFPYGNGTQGTEMSYYATYSNGMPYYPQILPPENRKSFEAMMVQTEYLVTEVNEIKSTLTGFMAEVRDTLGQLTTTVNHIQRISEMDRPKKKFRKVIHCPYEDCDRKYSSKIALNCHLRTKHKRRRGEE